MNGIEEKILQIISEKFGISPEQISLKSHLVGDFNVTSLEIADLISALEENFKIEIPDDESQKFETVEDIVNFVSDHTNELT